MTPGKIRLSALAALVLACFAATAPAAAPAPQSQRWTPEQLARAIERKADATSFAQLEQFGRDAMRLPGRARLDRLYHVAWILLNQSEFDRFKTWNGLLRSEAARMGDHRYLAVADINELRSRYDQGDTTAGEAIRRAAVDEPDWFARVHAQRTAAYLMVVESDVGAALKMLSDADASVPRDDPAAGMARAGVWEIEGVALMSLQDLRGSALAFGRSQFEFAPPSYPRPDFDGIYNMATLGAKIGDRKLAAELVAIHHRLVMKSDLPNLRLWDRNLCSLEAEGRNAPRDVLACFDGLNLDLRSAGFLATRILPARAIANARLGHIAAAERDLATLRRLHKAKAFKEATFARLPLVEAEVLRAKGDYREAYRLLLAYSDQHAVETAQQFSVGIGQLTGEMAKQLGVRREQLETAQRNAILQRDVINSQRLFTLFGALLGAVILGLLLWQWRVARQLRQARAASESANRAKSEFLANMSHEIRTPLNGVVGVADMLAKADLGPREREMVEIIRSSGDTLERLLSDILDFSRIESGRITIEAAPFHVGDMVRAVAGLWRLRCDEKGVILDVRVAPDLDSYALGDLVRIRQVLTNFLSNAVKFTEAGRISIEAVRTETGVARFTVTDTGVGFQMADKTRVLGRFLQADSSITRRFGGTGLGLAICSELAKLMGGVLDCDSVSGKGSRFWVDVPLPPAATVQPHATPETSSRDSGAELRILVADDHPTNRKVVELVLAGSGARLVMVENGAEALQAYRDAPFDLILMDMQMPVMDGVTAVREIRRLEAAAGGARIPIIMLTANALPEHIEQSHAAGADRHLGKPFTAADLFGAIDEAMAADPVVAGAQAA